MLHIVTLDKSHDRSSFDCGVPVLNTFLKATARQHDRKGISRTFVLTDDSPVILGFISLTLCEVLPASLPAQYAARFPSHSLPAVRLARLAVSRKHQGKGFGTLLLAEALHRTTLIAEQAGVIGLFVDAQDDAAKRFYEHYGFLNIPGHPLQLFLPIDTIRTAG